MISKTINLFADVVAPLAVVLLTIALFFVFEPEEPGVLFWFNMGYSAFLEVILLGYIVWLPRHGSSVVLKWMCGTFSIIYICVAFIWMLLFCVLVSWVSVKVYFSVVAVLTIIWVFVNATTAKVDNIDEVSNGRLRNNRALADRVMRNAGMLSSQFDLMKTAHPDLSIAASSVAMLCRGLATLSPSAMADESAAMRVNAILSGLEEVIEQPYSELSADRIKEYADKSIIKLNAIKQSIRK